MNPYIIYTIEGIVIVALAFIAWAINYERSEAVKKLSKERKQFDAGWKEQTEKLLTAQRELADNLNKTEEAEAIAKKHNERANDLRAELTSLELQLEENTTETYKLENAYARSKQMVEKLNKQIYKLNKKLNAIDHAKKHPKAPNGQFKAKYEFKETPKTND